MNVAASPPAARTPRFVLLGVLGALAAALLWFVGTKFHYLADYSVSSYTEYYWPRRVGLILHLSGGVLAISIGLVQVWLGLTSRFGQLHRVLGRLYGTGVLFGSVGGFYLALTIPGHLAYSAGLFMLCIAWLVTTGMALFAIRLRRIEQHRDWMLRSYTVTFAFVTFRLGSAWLSRWVHVPEDPVADDLDTLLAWACWAVPLLVAEALIQLRALRRPLGAAAGRTEFGRSAL